MPLSLLHSFYHPVTEKTSVGRDKNNIHNPVHSCFLVIGISDMLPLIKKLIYYKSPNLKCISMKPYSEGALSFKSWGWPAAFNWKACWIGYDPSHQKPIQIAGFLHNWEQWISVLTFPIFTSNSDPSFNALSVICTTVVFYALLNAALTT